MIYLKILIYNVLDYIYYVYYKIKEMIYDMFIYLKRYIN
jgi:hypothetical protein